LNAKEITDAQKKGSVWVLVAWIGLIAVITTSFALVGFRVNGELGIKEAQTTLAIALSFGVGSAVLFSLFRRAWFERQGERVDRFAVLGSVALIAIYASVAMFNVVTRTLGYADFALVCAAILAFNALTLIAITLKARSY
jgi:hypothetical protein